MHPPTIGSAWLIINSEEILSRKLRNFRLFNALQYAQKAVELDPSYAWTHNTLGLVYGNLGRKKDAISELKKAINLDPETLLFQENLN